MSGTTWIASTRRNIHPLTLILIINNPSSAFSIYYDPEHSPCSIYVLDRLAQPLFRSSLVYHGKATLNSLDMASMTITNILPKVIWEERIATPHSRYWTRSLHAQYPLQTNPITQPRLRYINKAMLHVSDMLHFTSCPIPPPKEFTPSLTGDIHPQSSHWNNG